MKKIAFLIPFLATLLFTSCEEDYKFNLEVAKKTKLNTLFGALVGTLPLLIGFYNNSIELINPINNILMSCYLFSW